LAGFQFRFTPAHLGGLDWTEHIVLDVHQPLGAHLEMSALDRHLDKIARLEFERIEDPLGDYDLAALADAADG
jgi:hypothetical protein